MANKLTLKIDQQGEFVVHSGDPSDQLFPLVVEITYPDVGVTGYLTQQQAEQLKAFLMENF